MSYSARSGGAGKYIIYSLHEQDVIQDQFLSSLTGLNSVFFLLDRLQYQGKRAQSALLFTQCWRENSWFHTFPKGTTMRVCVCIYIYIYLYIYFIKFLMVFEDLVTVFIPRFFKFF